MGRPSLYDPKVHPRLAYGFSLAGFVERDLADAIGVAHGTIDNWKAEHEEFAEAIARGKRPADAKVLRRLYRLCMGFTKGGKYYPPNPVAIIWWTKNRMGWRDKPEEEAPDVTDVVRAIVDGLKAADDADGV